MTTGVKIGMWCGVAGGILGLTLFFLWPQPFVPPEFSEARIRGAGLAKDISGSASRSLDALALIRLHDERKERAQALIVIGGEMTRSRETQEEAIRLSSELEKMARLITDIRPTRARLMATEAVSAEVALVSRLVSYNNNLLELFRVLQAKFENPSGNHDGRVRDLIQEINQEAQAINSFNERFNWSLAEFDKLFVN